MKHLLPDRVELAVLVALAVVCAVVVSRGANADYLLAMLAVPLFITAAVMGLRRNWKMADLQQAPIEPADRG